MSFQRGRGTLAGPSETREPKRQTLVAVALATLAGALVSLVAVTIRGDPSTGVSRIEAAAATR